MKLKRGFTIIFFLLFVSFVYAQPPFQEFDTSSSTFLDLRISDLPYIQTFTEYELKIHVFNGSNGYPINTGVSCYLHLYNEDLKHLVEISDVSPSHTYDYELKIGARNFSYIGVYPYIVQCNTSVIGGFLAGYIESTEDGKAPRPGFNFMILGGYFLLIFILIAFMHSYKKDIGATVVYGTIAFTISALFVWVIYSTDILNFQGNLDLWISALVLAIGLYCLAISWAFYNDLKKPTAFDG